MILITHIIIDLAYKISTKKKAKNIYRLSPSINAAGAISLRPDLPVYLLATLYSVWACEKVAPRRKKRKKYRSIIVGSGQVGLDWLAGSSLEGGR